MEKGEIWVEDEDEDGSSYPNNFMIRSSVSEIIEEEFDDHGRERILGTINEEFQTSGGGPDYDDDNVYVAVGKSDSSMVALKWALKNSLEPSSCVFLIHVFPEVHHIPTPLGRFPKNQASPEQLESYRSQERSKRREVLVKFLNLCSASRVKVDTILIESDLTAKAVSELIPILNIKKLVLGTTKSNLRKGKRKGIASEIQREAPEFCEVKIICEGKDVSGQMMIMATTPTTTMASPNLSPRTPTHNDEEEVQVRPDQNEEVINPRTPKQGSHSGNKNVKNRGTDDSFSCCSCFFSRFT
ncbi:U-box domain-containing protein 35-like [Macadamia integrifolia]|uniref:U-box domain-containing protein 35-like n=1 Tax=Macadamia integrifolia TaxID=60698 RepID=UPI001C530C7D|nr:U-box domain-containing protein 35-like [Macadamia integrifolia]